MFISFPEFYRGRQNSQDFNPFTHKIDEYKIQSGHEFCYIEHRAPYLTKSLRLLSAVRFYLVEIMHLVAFPEPPGGLFWS